MFRNQYDTDTTTWSPQGRKIERNQRETTIWARNYLSARDYLSVREVPLGPKII